MTKLQIKQRLMELIEASWSEVWPSARKREELVEYLSTEFRPAPTGYWEVRADQEMEVDASIPSMRPTYVVHRGDDEPYSSISQAEATAVTEMFNVLETQLRPKKLPP